MRNRERFLRQSRMALCAAGLIGLGVTSANASLDFKFDVQSLKLSSGDTATNVAGQGYNQVLIAPGSIVGLQLNAVVNAAPGGVTLGQQRGFWSTNGDFLSNDAGPGLDLSAAGASIIVNLNPVTIPAIDPFNKSGATAGIPVAGDLTDVWMRKSPVTATSLGSSNEVPPAPNASDAASATWYVAKLNVTGQAGTGTSVVSYQPEAVDGVLFVDNAGVQTTGGTPATVKVSADAANITGKAVAKVGAAGMQLTSLSVANGASLDVMGGGAVKMGALALGSSAKLDLGTSKAIVDGSSLLDVRSSIKAGAAGGWNGFGIVADLPQSDAGKYGLGYALGNDPNLASNNGTIGGLLFGPSSVIVKPTILGDADMDGDVDGTDVLYWSVNFTGSLLNPPTPASYWTTGDWDYDGDTDGSDVLLWSVNFTGSLLGGLSVSTSPEIAGNISPEAMQILNGMGVSVSVPEPATISILGIGGLMLLGRRRRR